MRYRIQITEEITYESTVNAKNEDDALQCFYDKHYNSDSIIEGETLDLIIEPLTTK